MLSRFAIRAAVSRLTAAITMSTCVALIPLASGAPSPAQAQATSVSVEFRTALEPHGKWQRHSRWGDIWVPARRDRGWRPYTVGRWVYTDDWGWYWTAGDSEAAWGWVVYHYGRWVLTDDAGWVWVPGNEWGPGWVNWRRGDEYFGWAPLPPDRVVVDYRDNPDVWVFVRPRDFVAPVIARVVLPAPEYRVIIRRTVIVNRTVVIRDRRIAVNPGIEPAIVAARIGRPLRAYDVRPVVVSGTVNIRNAVTVNETEIRQRRGQRMRVTVRETQNAIQPAKDVPKPQPLAENEQGRLGANPPRAARDDDRRDARDERQQQERRDSRQEREEQQKRRDTREQREEQQKRRDTRQDKRDGVEEQRRDTRQEQRDEQQKRRDTREQREERQERRDTRQEQRQDREQQRRDSRQEQRDQRQGAGEPQRRSAPSQTEGRSPPVTNELPRQPGPPRGAQPPGANEARRPPPRPPVTNELPRQPGPPAGAQPRAAPRASPGDAPRGGAQPPQEGRRP